MVVAPKENKHDLKKQIQINIVENQIKNRFAKYPEKFRIEKRENAILQKVKNTDVCFTTYESWIEKFKDFKYTYEELNNFYKESKKWNNIPKK